ncbi:rod shape-determining protein RodA [Leptonema illini]|uniref:Cell cycle protein n=1 Tax=Leptonema illini DSM 21528 TaxID=929563 RepID=H2CEN9_9LEPT|nr:rod shape-determining protein RodA [Leptonema illini]EHQ06651.1 cell cycle protein [Leptonema illini DSM 21528]
MFRKARIDLVLVLAVTLVSLAGIFTLYTQDIDAANPSYRWMKQLSFFVIGFIIMLVLRKTNYQALGNVSLPIYGFAILLLIVTFFIGSEIKGARSWIRIGPFGFQTSEFAKLAAVILLAKYLELKEKDMEQITSLIIPFSIFLLPMLLIVIQPDLGGAVILAPILLSMLFVAGMDIYHISSILLFFSISMSIPLYIEYNNIMLVDGLLNRLLDLGKEGLLPSVRILRSDIWKFLENGNIPAALSGTDLDYLTRVRDNPTLFIEFQEIARALRYESGGFLLRILDADWFIVLLGSAMTLAAGGMFIWRMTQGGSWRYLRKYYIPLGVIGLSLLSAFAIHSTFSFKYHQIVRVTAFINPDRFPRDLAYQIRASKAAIGSGQVVGKGMFTGEMTVGENPVVPEAFTDFIFTAWAERTGFIGSALLLILLLLIPIRGFQIGLDARDKFGSLLATGISFVFLYHIVFNVGIELGLMPVTGLPLSFMSYGGSHLLMCMTAVGILLNIHQRKHAN